MNLCFNAPINSVSFGQVSVAILRELFRREEVAVSICPIGKEIQLDAQEPNAPFFEWINECVDNFETIHSRKNSCLKLWHLKGSLESVGEQQTLISFYETDKPTKTELNIARNNKMVFTSQHAVDVFKNEGVEANYVPLGFDHHNFKVINKKFHDDDRIVFSLCGKLERRKRHEKVIRAWIKKFGNDKRYFLHASIYNHFLTPEQNNDLIGKVLDNKKYFNAIFYPFMAKNTTYNEFLNASNIVIGVSGGEGWGLPEFQSVALGKYGIIVDAHGYKGWANKDNSILIKPTSNKIDCYDNVFFREGDKFNQGKIFDFDEDEFINACELAISKCQEDLVNKEGLKLQNDFTFEKTVDNLLQLL